MADALTAFALKTLLSVAQGYASSFSAPLPANPTPISAPQSLGDAGEAILKCYHPSGRLLNTAVVQRPWNGARTYNARGSVVLQIRWKGAVGARHSSLVALMERDGRIKTVLLQNGTPIPADPKCRLDQWTKVER